MKWKLFLIIFYGTCEVLRGAYVNGKYIYNEISWLNFNLQVKYPTLVKQTD